MTDPITWPQAFAIASGVAGFVFALTFLCPIPWLMLATYLESREQRKMMLAKAQLKEAEATLLKAKGASNAE